MIKADFHTHSRRSHDGAITIDQYRQAIAREHIDVVAITDHGGTEYALEAQHEEDFHEAVIVGQEILSNHGEIIGLFLSDSVPDGLSAAETVQYIKNQGGFVLIPHPEDPHRSGMSQQDMETIKQSIDAIELHNGRQIGKPAVNLRRWAIDNDISMVACSDAHVVGGLGRTYTRLPRVPISAEDLRDILRDEATDLVHERPPFRTYLAPKYNRLKKWLRARLMLS